MVPGLLIQFFQFAVLCPQLSFWLCGVQVLGYDLVLEFQFMSVFTQYSALGYLVQCIVVFLGFPLVFHFHGSFPGCSCSQVLLLSVLFCPPVLLDSVQLCLIFPSVSFLTTSCVYLRPQFSKGLCFSSWCTPLGVFLLAQKMHVWLSFALYFL